MLTGLLFAMALTQAPPLNGRVTDMRALALHDGVNRLGTLWPGGGDITIVQGVPKVEDADQTHSRFMVLVGERGGNWTLAPFCADARTDGDCPDTVIAAPRDGESGVAAVVFVEAKLDGRPTLLLARAVRDMAHAATQVSPAPVVVHVSALTEDQAFGETFFREIGEAKAPGCYVDATLALRTAIGLPLPTGYEGARTPAACPSRARSRTGEQPGR